MGSGDGRAARRDPDQRATATLSVRGVTPNLFALLGVQPLLGRAFAAQADSPSVVIAYPVWQRLFEGRPDVVGQSLWIGEQLYQVAGVMPDRFWLLETGGYVWTPLDTSRLPGDARLTTFVRRPSGLSAPAVKETLTTGLAESARSLPEAERAVRADLAAIGGTPIGRAMSIFLPYLLAACVVLVWLIACANVAILMIARWTAREHEIAVRAALGASRGRVVQLLLVESLIVAAAGGILGICVTFALRGLLVANAGPAIASFDTSIKPYVLLDAVVLTMVTGLLAGLGPALYETRRLVANPLRTMTSERLRQRWRHGLVVAEIAVTAALLVVTGQMIDGYRRQASADVGFATDNLMIVGVESETGVQAAAVLDHIKNLPGVASVTMSTSAPFTRRDTTLHSASLRGGDSGALKVEAPRVGETFFSTLGVAVPAGRGFSTADAGTQPTVAMVNETLARQLWPEGTPVGSRIVAGQSRLRRHRRRRRLSLRPLLDGHTRGVLAAVAERHRLSSQLSSPNTDAGGAVHIEPPARNPQGREGACDRQRQHRQ